MVEEQQGKGVRVMVKVNKRAWEMRPVRLSVFNSEHPGTSCHSLEFPSEAYGPDGDGPKPRFLVIAESFSMLRVRDDEVWGVEGWGDTVADAVSMVRRKWLKMLASGEYRHERWWE